MAGGILFLLFLFFQAEDGIRDLVRSRGLGDVYKRQVVKPRVGWGGMGMLRVDDTGAFRAPEGFIPEDYVCLLYTSDAADDLLCVDLGGCRLIQKKRINKIDNIVNQHT